MDGPNGKTISGLSYSAEKRQLYWLNVKKLSIQFWDFRTRRLESMDIDKSSLIGRFSPSPSLANPNLTSLAVHGDDLYISSGGILFRAKNELDTILTPVSSSILVMISHFTVPIICLRGSCALKV